MQIAPRYDADPLIVLPGDDPDAATGACARQRRRFAATLATLEDAQWAAPSRCEGWTVKDVVSHLDSTNGFWEISIASAIDGRPTRFLESFDPKATPAALAEADAATSPVDLLERFTASCEALCVAVEALGPEQLAVIGEAPPGHIALHGVVLHALWDSWVHERDVLLPLGLPAVEEPDELVESLRYAIALAPALALSADPGLAGRVAVEVTDPDARFWVEAGPDAVVHEGPAPGGTPIVRGRAVEVLEGLSVRAPLSVDLPDDQRWLVDGLAAVFEVR